MGTLYRPVLIETAEQAEGLPEGSLVRDVRSGFDYRARHALGGYLQADLDAGVDVEALVPTTTTERTTAMDFLRTCRARRFCACTSCLSLMFDTEGGSHRGVPLALTDERARATSGYAPTHRKDA